MGIASSTLLAVVAGSFLLENMEPRRSRKVCILMAALVFRKCAQGKRDRHRSMVVESKA